MSRRRRAIKRVTLPDPTYNSRLVQMVVNRVMKDGKKQLAYKLVYNTLEALKSKTEEDGLQVFQSAIQNAKPEKEVKAQRVGGATYQIPREVSLERGTVLAIQWILTAARKRAGATFTIKLTNEIFDAFNNTGNAVKRRTEVEKMAEANRAFSRARN